MTSERILIVDEDAALRTLIAEMSSRYGFVPVAAESAEAALRVVTEDPPDVAIINQQVHDASAAQFVRSLRASHDERLRSLPVIGLCGRRLSKGEAMNAGACCFVRKPVEVQRLVQAIRWALEVYRPHVATG